MTTEGRVPLLAPGAETTLMPTTSCVDTRLRQASLTVGLAVRLVIARLTIDWILSTRGLKASVAARSWTISTRARGTELPAEKVSAPREDPKESTSSRAVN